MKKFVAFVFLLALSVSALNAQEKKKKSFSLEDFERIDGFIPILYDEKKDRVALEISETNKEFLYQVSLTTGVGSNPIGLDRGQLGNSKVVSFRKSGNKLLLVQPNYRYRALSDNPAEVRAVKESFAESVIWGFPIAATIDGKHYIDATALFMRDAHGVAARLNRLKEGSFKFDKTRSSFYRKNLRAFPKNSEIETLVTVKASGRTGRLVNSTVPSGDSVTTRQRHSLIELPDSNYKPRVSDPRVGVFGISFYDYATRIDQNLEKRWIARHRLESKNPGSNSSEAVEPIVYYVDNGTPKDIRDALIEGASWWNQAFEAAGFKDAFQVKVLPENADPMDVRYNIINWVHRSTRGWAYGSTITDPRTGEIIRGVVTLDSQRARQDMLISSSLVPQHSANACFVGMSPHSSYFPQSKQSAYELSIARIRQLSAHEIGHTIGLAHNFAASTYNRASVMDYPAPMIKISNGKLDFSSAYDVGIGEYDKFAINYTYRHFPDGSNENEELRKIVEKGVADGMLFISDADTRPASAAHPLANLWDNGADPIANLKHEMNVRKIGLANFGIKNLAEGEPLSNLERRILPLYLHHRYQTTAAAKSIGGVYYTYAVRKGAKGNPEKVYEIVPATRQREALSTVLMTLDKNNLKLPDSIIESIPPQAFGTGSQRSERFGRKTRPVLDVIGMAEIAANLSVGALLEPNRAMRLETQHARDSSYPSFSQVLDSLMLMTIPKTESKGYDLLIEEAVRDVVIEQLMSLASNDAANTRIRRLAQMKLRSLTRSSRDSLDQERRSDIERFLARPFMPRKMTRQLPDPPSDPIGSN